MCHCVLLFEPKSILQALECYSNQLSWTDIDIDISKKSNWFPNWTSWFQNIVIHKHKCQLQHFYQTYWISNPVTHCNKPRIMSRNNAAMTKYNTLPGLLYTTTYIWSRVWTYSCAVIWSLCVSSIITKMCVIPSSILCSQYTNTIATQSVVNDHE